MHKNSLKDHICTLIYKYTLAHTYTQSYIHTHKCIHFHTQKVIGTHMYIACTKWLLDREFCHGDI